MWSRHCQSFCGSCVIWCRFFFTNQKSDKQGHEQLAPTTTPNKNRIIQIIFLGLTYQWLNHFKLAANKRKQERKKGKSFCLFIILHEASTTRHDTVPHIGGWRCGGKLWLAFLWCCSINLHPQPGRCSKQVCTIKTTACLEPFQLAVFESHRAHTNGCGCICSRWSAEWT